MPFFSLIFVAIGLKTFQSCFFFLIFSKIPSLGGTISTKKKREIAKGTLKLKSIGEILGKTKKKNVSKNKTK